MCILPDDSERMKRHLERIGTMAQIKDDPRGPMRLIINVVRKTDGDYITCDCGHTSLKAHADWKYETHTRCFKCL